MFIIPSACCSNKTQRPLHSRPLLDTWRKQRASTKQFINNCLKWDTTHLDLKRWNTWKSDPYVLECVGSYPSILSSYNYACRATTFLVHPNSRLFHIAAQGWSSWSKPYGHPLLFRNWLKLAEKGVFPLMVKDFGIFEFLLGPCLLFFSLDFPLKKLTLMSFYVVPFFIIVGETEKNWDNFRERVKKFIRELQLYKKYIYTMI